jgi:hypothetical protein
MQRGLRPLAKRDVERIAKGNFRITSHGLPTVLIMIFTVPYRHLALLNWCFATRKKLSN